MSNDQSGSMDAQRMLRRLSRGLERREALPGGAAREGLDAQLLELVSALRSRVQRTLLSDLVSKPPRAVTLGLAQALYSQPHLQTLFTEVATEATDGTELPQMQLSDRPVVLPTELVRDVLMLQDWELDELREEVDRRMGLVLKQSRALQWLWDHFSLPEANPEHMFRVLFPAAPAQLGRVSMIRYGAQLYAVLDQSPPPPPSALFISWVDTDQADSYAPLGTFGGQYVDRDLRRSLARAIGSDDDEVVQILDAMITVIPRQRAAEFVAHDLWRVRGMANVTGLGAPYTRATWLTRALLPDELPFEDWMAVRDGKVTMHNLLVAWDGMATRRVVEMLRQLHAEMLARLNKPGDDASTDPQIEDLSLYHLKSHLKRVLMPLIRWAESPETAWFVAQRLDVEEDEATAALNDIVRTWTERAEQYWWGEPTEERPRTVRCALTLHVLCVHDTLRKAHALKDDESRFAHADLLLLFAGHYFANLDLVRRVALGETDSDAEDVFASWFLGLWRRLMARVDPDMSTFSGSLHMPTSPPATADSD